MFFNIFRICSFGVVIFYALFNSYIIELSYQLLGNKYIYTLVIFYVIFYGVFSILSIFYIQKSSILTSHFYLYIFLMVYTTSTLFFTPETRLSIYLISQFIISVFVFFCLAYSFANISVDQIIKTVIGLVIIFLIASLYIDIMNIPRAFISENALWNCNSRWTGRLCGASINPNALGSVSLMIFYFALYLLYFNYKALSMLLITIVLILAFMSLSRTTIISVIFGCYLVLWQKYFKASLLVTVTIISVLLFFVVSSGLSTSGRFSIESMISASGRADIFKSALVYVNQSPIFGNGFNLIREYDHNGQVWNRLLDNSYLNLLISLGFTGLLLFLFLMVYCFEQHRKINKVNVIIFVTFLLTLLFEERLVRGLHLSVIFSLTYLGLKLDQENFGNKRLANNIIQ